MTLLSRVFIQQRLSRPSWVPVEIPSGHCSRTMWLLVWHGGNRTEMASILIKEKQQRVLIRSLGSMFRGVSLNPDFLISEQGNIMPCLLCLGFLCICNSGMITLFDSLSLTIMREEYLRDITALYLTDCFLDHDILGADKNFQCYYFISCHLPVCTTVLDFSRTRVFVPFKPGALELSTIPYA